MSVGSRRLAAAWVDGVRRRAVLVTALAAVLTAASVHYSVGHFSIDTDPDEMLSKELPYRRKGAELAEVFPQYPNSIVVIVDGPNADLVDRAAEELTAAIGKRPDLFDPVFDPQGMRFFRQNGLLYLDTDELSDLVDRVAAAQPLLGTLWSEPNLPGLFDVLRRAVEEARKGEAPLEIDFVFEEIAAVVEAQAAGATGYLSWQELMRGRRLDPEERRRLIVIQPRLDYRSFQPAGRSLDELHRLDADLRLRERYGARIRVTGPTALETEELRSVQQGGTVATLLSIALVTAILWAGLRSARLFAATQLTLLCGLAWSAALAFLLVGRLNLLSVAFAVLFIGLSDEFGMHYALRVREAIDDGRDPATALREAAQGTAGSTALCAVAAAIGFFSFLPTDYAGLAELGLIAGASMFVALFANLTLLPALLALLPPRPSRFAGRDRVTKLARLHPGEFIRRHARGIIAGTVIVSALGLLVATRARFDFDPMNLRDSESESVKALFELADDRRTTPYKIVELAESLDSASRLAKRAETLDVVDNATTLLDFVPAAQEEKLEILESASLFILPSLSGEPGSAANAETQRRSLARFREELAAMTASAAGENEAAAERRLAAAIDRLEHARGLGDDVVADLEERLVATLPARLADLRLSLGARSVTLEDLPETVRRRWLAPDGRARLEITPARNLLHNDAALWEFVLAVRAIIPGASGMPVDIVESGKAVVRSFVEATVLSMALIAAIVFLLLRRIRDVSLIFAPLGLAALLTVASTVLLRQPFNFANVIVLPLLFGLGVSSAIHLVMRDREETGAADVLATSTPWAVVLSSLTTIGSFASLALIRHPGIASMGILLTVAIAMTLVCTLVVLPALMEIFPIQKSGASRDYGEEEPSGTGPSRASGSSSSSSRS